MVNSSEPKNAWGIAGFVGSLAGLLTCGALSPVALVVSLIGVTRRPRGFASVGIAVSLIGTVWFAFWGMALVWAFMAASKGVGVGETLAGSGASYITIVQARDAVAAEKRANPAATEAELAAIASKYKDAWGRPLRFDRMGDTFKVVSNGADGESGSVDDLPLGENEAVPAEK